MTVERVVFVIVGIAIGFGAMAIMVFVHAWIQGWRDLRNAEASARGYENDDLV